MTSQCTDQCVVIACNDPDHPGAHCEGGTDQVLCNLVCDSSTNCVDCNGFDAFLQCCSDYHSYLSDGQQQQVHWARGQQQQNHGQAQQNMWCDDCVDPPPPPPQQQQPPSFQQPLPAMVPPQTSPRPLPDRPHKCMWHGCKHSFASLSDLVGHVNLIHLRPLPEATTDLHQQQQHQAPVPSTPPPLHPQHQQPDSSSVVVKSPVSCLWDDCSLYLSPENIAGTSSSSEFSNLLSALECHLLQDHLGLHTSPTCLFRQDNHDNALGASSSSSSPSSAIPSNNSFFYEGSAFQNHFHQQHGSHHHCDAGMEGPLFAAAAAAAGGGGSHGRHHHHHLPSSSSSSTTTATAATASDSAAATPSSSSSSAFGDVPSVHPSPLLEEQRLSTSTPPSSVSTPQHQQQQQQHHPCLWQDCKATFSSSDDLTAHLTSAHVGGGKARYECFWKDCDRHGERGFSSKQKICRHLQSHTGHRPFQCTLCHQNFSEAATLQQHMRRHTQEKPYSCDFPGCGKSFAIMGALTIHKRIHNGQKPFKCTYCDRAFTESSNLSKHLRTHTGARPYTCTDPGCGKSFARPDQLTRHMGVHKKNLALAANPQI